MRSVDHRAADGTRSSRPNLAAAGREAVETELNALSLRAAELEKKLDRASHEREEYRKLYELASLQLERLRTHLFGKKSERVSAEQLALSFEALTKLLGDVPSVSPQEAEDAAPEPGSRNEPRKRVESGSRGRQPLPEHLPVETIVLLPAELQGDERDDFECIGEEITETLEHRSASEVRVRVVRPKIVRKGSPEAGVMTAPPPELPIERGLAGPGLLAQVIVDKFEDHQGLHRQERRFLREACTSPTAHWAVGSTRSTRCAIRSCSPCARTRRRPVRSSRPMPRAYLCWIRKLHGMEPYAYLRDLFCLLPTWPRSRA